MIRRRTVSFFVIEKGRGNFDEISDKKIRRERTRALICNPIPTKTENPKRVKIPLCQKGDCSDFEMLVKIKKAIAKRKRSGVKKAKSSKKGKGVTS